MIGKCFIHLRSEDLVRLADFFDVSIDYLVGRIEKTEACVDKEDLCRRIDAIRQELNVLKNYL